MMRVNWTAWVSLFVLALLFPVSEAADEPKEKTRLPAKVKEGSTQVPLWIEEVFTQHTQEPERKRIPMPKYKPPQRGAPGGRVGGGTRGGPG